jgi:hypothetical protein
MISDSGVTMCLILCHTRGSRHGLVPTMPERLQLHRLDIEGELDPICFCSYAQGSQMCKQAFLTGLIGPRLIRKAIAATADEAGSISPARLVSVDGLAPSRLRRLRATSACDRTAIWVWPRRSGSFGKVAVGNRPARHEGLRSAMASDAFRASHVVAEARLQRAACRTTTVRLAR